MSSDDSKDAIVSYYDDAGVETAAKDWKRRAKIKGPIAGSFMRSFANDALALECHVYEHPAMSHETVYEGGKLWYAVIGNTHNAPEDDSGDQWDGPFSVTFTTDQFYRHNDTTSDQEISTLLEMIYGLPDTWSEASENSFYPPRGTTLEDAHALLLGLGAELHQEIYDGERDTDEDDDLSESRNPIVVTVYHFSRFERISTDYADWKIIRDIPVEGVSHVVELRNDNADLTALVYSEDDEEEGLIVHEGGDLLYDIYDDEEHGLSLMFVPKSFWERNHHFPDQHWGVVLEAAYNISDDIVGDEAMENTFMPDTKYTRDDLIATLAKCGAVYDSTLRAIAMSGSTPFPSVQETPLRVAIARAAACCEDENEDGDLLLYFTNSVIETAGWFDKEYDLFEGIRLNWEFIYSSIDEWQPYSGNTPLGFQTIEIDGRAFEYCAFIATVDTDNDGEQAAYFLVYLDKAGDLKSYAPSSHNPAPDRETDVVMRWEILEPEIVAFFEKLARDNSLNEGTTRVVETPVEKPHPVWTFHIDDDIPEETIWERFRQDGKFICFYSDNKRHDVVKKTYFDFYFDEADPEGFNFMAGYENAEGRLVENINIPATVFEVMFPNNQNIDWNCAEQTHEYTFAPGETYEDAKAALRAVFLTNGFEEI